MTKEGGMRRMDSLARDSINMSTPLFLNSYRPAVNKYKVFSRSKS
jgi:hypothetical protein